MQSVSIMLSPIYVGEDQRSEWVVFLTSLEAFRGGMTSNQDGEQDVSMVSISKGPPLRQVRIYS